jgi:hypothetical protein
MHVHGSRALTAEGAAMAAITSAVGADDGGANYFETRLLFWHTWTHGGWRLTRGSTGR